MPAVRRLLASAGLTVLMFPLIAGPVEATMLPSSVRLARLFDRPQWAGLNGSSVGLPGWHLTERLELSNGS